MSEPKRYILVEISGEQWMHEKENKMTPAKPGEFIRWEDYARLQAEVERLTEERCFLNERLNHFVKETVKNREQVERLRKAGDDLYKSMLEIGCNEMADNFQYDAWWGSMRSWQSAKEGKQP